MWRTCWGTYTLKARCDMDDRKAEGPHPPGTVRHKAGQVWVVTSPGSPLYSTATMCATEFWTGVEWRSIWPTEEADSI